MKLTKEEALKKIEELRSYVSGLDGNDEWVKIDYSVIPKIDGPTVIARSAGWNYGAGDGPFTLYTGYSGNIVGFRCAR